MTTARGFGRSTPLARPGYGGVIPAAITAFAIITGAPGAAHAGGLVGGEVGMGANKPYPTVQSSYFESQKVFGRGPVTRTFEIGASLKVAHDFAAPIAAGSSYRSGDDWYAALAVDADIALSDRWTLNVGGSAIPPYSREVGSSVAYPGGGRTAAGAIAEGVVATRNWSAGGSVDVDYDSAGDAEEPPAYSTNLTVGVGLLDYATAQHLVDFAAPGSVGPSSVDALLQRCATRKTFLCDAVRTTSLVSRSSLAQVRLDAAAIETILTDTDVGLDVGVYLYDQDPATAGFYQTKVQNASGASGTLSYGAGLPVAPVRLSLRPDIVHRFGAVDGRVAYEFDDAAIPDLVSHSVSAKLTVRLGSVRPYVAGGVRADLGGGITSTSWNASLGVQYRPH